jgi:hypothetical protein
MSRLWRRRRAELTGKKRLGLAGLVAMTLAAAGVTVVPSAAAPAVGSSTAGGCPPHGRAVCVDRADSGRRVHVKTGQTVTVALSGTTLKWSGLRQVGPTLLRFKSAVVHDGGLTASYAAVKAGATVLRASGAPKCSHGKACPQFIVVWQVRVRVG